MADWLSESSSQCDRCQFNACSEFLLCAVHPTGPIVAGDCPDFEPWPEGAVFWVPVGSGFYEVEEGQIPNKLGLMEQLERIENHPIFTGHCPQCGFQLGFAVRYLWDCERCGWQDDLKAEAS